MLRGLILALVVLIAAACGVFWYLTVPKGLSQAQLVRLQPGDAANGEAVFWAGGCSSCHAAPDAKGDDKLKLGGGLKLKTAFGTFAVPNISSDKADGLGSWSVDDFANAVMRGVSPSGRHLYPAFPYPSYARMKPQDAADLFAYMKTLPSVSGKPPESDLAFPYNIRRGVGLWKLLYMRETPVIGLADDATDAQKRGRYLVEGPGHCGECHTPRLFTGGLKFDQWLAGAAAPEGDGTVPNITPGEDGLKSWSESDIAYFLESGFTPDYDSVGGDMVKVQENMARLTDADRKAIAAYLKAVPPHPDGYATSGK